MNRRTGERALRAGLSFLVLTALQAGCQQSRTPPAASPAAEQAWLSGVVSIGVKNDQPGLDFKDGYKNSGFEYELINFLADKLGVKVNLVDVPSEQREEALKDNRVKLVIASYSITADRKASVDFAGPYLETQQQLLVRSDDNDIQEKADVATKDICTVQGTTSDPNLGSTAASPAPNPLVPGYVHTLPNFRACVDELLAEKTDAVFTDTSILYGFTQAHEKKLKVLPLVFGVRNRYGIGLPKGHQADCRRLMGLVQEFLRDKWNEKFSETLWSINKSDVSQYRPRHDDVTAYSSCGG
ncbi:transporter substrate-binding domain-containing protein [Kitasatospora sp. NPDC004531]